MRTREKSYSDYGITDHEKRYILDFCRQANEEEKMLIKNALSEIHTYISPYIYRSLTDGISYNNICKMDYIYMRPEDFYAYRRKGMEAIKRWMILCGIWNCNENR